MIPNEPTRPAKPAFPINRMYPHGYAPGGPVGDVHILALTKGREGRERYIFMFDDAHRADILRTLGRFAGSTDLSFTWYDAAVLSQKVRAGMAKNDCEGK